MSNDIVIVGAMTRLYGRLMESIAQAPAVGRYLLKTGLLRGKTSRQIILRPIRRCRNTNPEAALEERAFPGMFIVRYE